MTVSPEEIILQAFYDQLQTVDGSGTWSFDLRGQVLYEPIFGRSGLSLTDPAVGIYCPQSEGTVYTTARQKRTSSVHVEAWVPGTTFKDRQANGWRLRYDIERAIAQGTDIRVAIATAAATLGTTTLQNAVIAEGLTAKAHGDEEVNEALLAVHLIYRVTYDTTLAGVR